MLFPRMHHVMNNQCLSFLWSVLLALLYNTFRRPVSSCHVREEEEKLPLWGWADLWNSEKGPAGSTQPAYERKRQNP